jgi:ABC-type branched-subunit amino acid transport system substrate-binding protein
MLSALLSSPLGLRAGQVGGADGGTIRFGQSASLTGGQARYGADVRTGILAAFAGAERNDSGRRLHFELETLDDGGNKERCVANVQRFIGDGAVGLIGLTSGAAAEASLQIIEAEKIPLLGTATGNMGLRDPNLRMPFHIRAGYDAEYAAMLRYVKDFGMKRIGYVHLKDTSPANEKAMTSALEKIGVKLETSVALDRNAKSYEAEAYQLLQAELNCVLFTTNAAPIEAIVEAMAAKGYPGFYFSSSFAGQALIDAMAKRGQAIIMSQVVPRPNAIASPLIKRYQEDLAAFDKSAKPGYTSLEGYIAGRTAVEVGRAAASSGAVTRARFVEALTQANLSFGGYSVRFNNGVHDGSRWVDIVALARSGQIIG